MKTCVSLAHLLFVIASLLACVSVAQGQAQFPISASQQDSINGIGYMHTDVSIASSGQLTATMLG